MRHPQSFKLNGSSLRELKSWLRSTTLPQGQITRAKILLGLHAGKTPTQISEEQLVSTKTVHKWRNRFQSNGIEGLLDEQRNGRPTVIDESIVKKVLTFTTEYVPEEATQWSERLMAEHVGITPYQVRKIWKTADLQPHRLRTFKVLSVDEKTQIQALDRTQPGLPLASSRVGSRTHDYKRHGTTSLYAAFNILTGRVIGKVAKRTRSKEFLSFLKQINRNHPAGKDLHIILDNHSAHKTKEVMEWLEERPYIHFHFTPTSASWLNAVEGWFAQLERRALYRGIFTSVAELQDTLLEFIQVHNRTSAKPFIWKKDAKTILSAVNRAKNALPN